MEVREELLGNDDNASKQINRAKMLELWRAEKKKKNQSDNGFISKALESTSQGKNLSPPPPIRSNQSNTINTANNNMRGEITPANSGSKLSFYRSIFDRQKTTPNITSSFPSSASKSISTPLSTIRPRNVLDGKRVPVNSQGIAMDDKLNKLQSLADKVSSLFPSNQPSFEPLDSRKSTESTRASVGEGNLSAKATPETKHRMYSISRHSIAPSSSQDTESIDDVSGRALKQSHAQLRDRLRHTESLLEHIQEEYEALKTKIVENENRISMAVEEHQALSFMIEVLCMRVRELEVEASNNRLKHNELLSEKTKKHKVELKRVTKERAEYESQTNELIGQMNNQMNDLQAMAMERIGGLEKELMDERRKNSDLEAKLARIDNGIRRGDVSYDRVQSPYMRRKESVDSKDDSEDESEGSSKRDSDFEIVGRRFPSRRRETLLHLKSESKLRREEGDHYLGEI